MNITINLEPIFDFFDLPPETVFIKLFLTVGWIPIAIAFLWGSAQVWLRYIRLRWTRAHSFTLLAIDIPRGNMQSPKAVENIFAYLAGAHGTYNLHEKWWLGENQLSLSLEIVGIDGYIQFLIRTPSIFRNLVESAVYSQYPDAEITEVNDYTEGYPTIFPDEQYDIWGAEFKQVKNKFYPIKTYEDFEHQFGEPEMQYKDPMAALMDLLSSLRKGEQIWYQIILIPIDSKWSEEAEEEVKKVIGEKTQKKNLADKITDGLIVWMGKFSEAVYQLWGDIEEKEAKKEDEPFRMMNLKPKQKRQIEGIQDKVGKLGFGVKIRFIYLAKKEVMNKPKAANGFVGYIKQFNTNDLNSLKPDVGARGTATKVDYPIFYNYRLNVKKRKIFRAYKKRDDTAGRLPGIFNTEELASIWHFPVESVVKAPLIQKAPGRKYEPPASLPLAKEADLVASPFEEKTKASEASDIFSGEIIEENKDIVEQPEKDGTPPSNLPFA